MVVDVIALRIALSSMLRQKKTLFALLISLVPIAAAALAMLEDGGEFGLRSGWNPAFSDMAAFMVITATLPLMVLLLAGGMIADEAEERTLSYLLVRPIPRVHLYLSRAVAVLIVAVPMMLVQVVGLWAMRWISYARFAGPGTRVFVESGDATVSAAALMWVMLPVVVGACLVATLFYGALFGLTSLISTRYHFFINLGYLGVWEGILGHMPFGGQRLTATHHLASMVDHADGTANIILGVPATDPAIGVPVLLMLAVLWVLGAMIVVRNRDFHVTSAAT